MVPSRREFLTNAGLTGVAALVGRPSPVGYAYAQVRLDQDVRMIRSPGRHSRGRRNTSSLV